MYPQPDKCYWALTPHGWVQCDGVDAHPVDAVVVTLIEPLGTPDLETGVRPTHSQTIRVDEDGDKETLVARFGSAPLYPIPVASVQAITEKVTRTLGPRSKSRSAWDELRNALIEARYLRGLVASGTAE